MAEWDVRATVQRQRFSKQSASNHAEERHQNRTISRDFREATPAWRTFLFIFRKTQHKCLAGS